jgi:hypothetical protein
MGVGSTNEKVEHDVGAPTEQNTLYMIKTKPMKKDTHF